jgi:hypothetical protein
MYRLRRFRSIVVVVWLVGAAAAHASRPWPAVTEPSEEQSEEQLARAVLSVDPVGITASAVRLGSSPSPPQETQSSAFLATLVEAQLIATAPTDEDSVDIAQEPSARPHPQRGPPLSS